MTTSTPRASRACWPARRPIPARPCCAPAPPSPPPLAWSATREARPASAFALARGHRRAKRRRSRSRAGLGRSGRDSAPTIPGPPRCGSRLETDLPVIVDADALTILAAHPDLVAGRTAPTVLTPHAGEFARLAGAPPGDDRVAATRRLADRLGATVLLKGNVTVIAEPGGPGLPQPGGAVLGCHRRIGRRAVRASSARCWPRGSPVVRPRRRPPSCMPVPPTCRPPTPGRSRRRRRRRASSLTSVPPSPPYRKDLPCRASCTHASHIDPGLHRPAVRWRRSRRCGCPTRRWIPTPRTASSTTS